MKKNTNTKIVLRKKKNNSEIISSDYKNFLLQIQKHIEETQTNIIHSITRQKVVMAWQIGKSINEYLVGKKETGFGEKLVEQLAEDILISKSSLYEMRNFYKTYPELPKDNASLNWSHYQKLSRIKRVSERKYFEELVLEKNWDVARLEKKVIEVQKRELQKISQRNSAKNSNKAKINSTAAEIPKLKPTRGKLFAYPLIKIPSTGKTYVDCGFSIFREVKEVLPKSAREKKSVDVVKEKQNYSFGKSAVNANKFNTYKAYLNRVVDGDTIRFTIDLGFEILHEEIIRLAKINAPEMNTFKGKKSAKFLTDFLKDIPFFVIKTMKTDIYGRYVADVFFSENKNETDASTIAETGIYLNQALLDKKMVEVFE